MGQVSILIVEDERIVAKDLQQTLQGWGYGPVRIASSCSEALQRLEENRPDLVLMDIRIQGGVDGIGTAQLLQQVCDAPIIYLTAHGDTSYLERARETRPQAYILKPIKGPELRAALELGLERHRGERALRERDRWYYSTLCAIRDAVVTVDNKGCITFMNPVAEQLTGRRLSQSMGCPVEEVIELLDGHELPLPITTALREGRPVEGWRGRIRCHQTRQAYPVADSAAPVMDGERNLGAVMVFRDVTLEESLRQQLELSQRLASLGTIAAGVAHEINNPLAAILGSASLAQSMLRKDWTPEIHSEVSEIIDELLESSQRIRKIVSDLQSFGRRSSSPKGRCDLLHGLNWALRVAGHAFRTKPQVHSKFLTPPIVQLDETRLGQVLVNLLVNAAQAMEGRPRQEVDISLTPAHGPGVMVKIRDSGCGIPADQLHRVFDPFHTTKPPGKGTGLGLSIVHSIVTQAGGEIDLSSEVGVGTTVRLLLPLVERPEAGQSAER